METKTLSASIGCWLLLIAATAAQAPTDNQLVSLFADLRQNRGVVSPDIERRLQVAISAIPSMPTGQLSEAIPTIVAALSAEEERVQGIAALAGFAIVKHPEGTSLLARDLPAVVSLLQSSSARVGTFAGLILLNAKTTLDPSLMSRIVTAINQRNRRAADRVPALATAVGLAPSDAAVIGAVTDFMLEPLDAPTKTEALRAMRASRIDAPPLRLELVAWLQDSDTQVKLGAISVLTRMGPEAVDLAKFELQRITQRETEPNEVRGAATKALQMLQ